MQSWSASVISIASTFLLLFLEKAQKVQKKSKQSFYSYVFELTTVETILIIKLWLLKCKRISGMFGQSSTAEKVKRTQFGFNLEISSVIICFFFIYNTHDA
jgi:hypothetical protein